ncbi:MAG: response regulator transcription factor [Anaerolineales bacterium]
MDKPYSLLIADEHEGLRREIQSILTSMAEFNVIGNVDSGVEVLKNVKRFKPNLILMEMKFPDMDGSKLIHQIKRISPNTNIVIFTTYQDEEIILSALEAGATSYLLKDVHSDKLIEALLHAQRGETVLHPLVATKVLNILLTPDPLKHKITSQLTKREAQVLKLVASGLNNQEIAGKLFISVSTAKAHVSNILGKLHLSDRTQAAAFAWETGFMQRER